MIDFSNFEGEVLSRARKYGLIGKRVKEPAERAMVFFFEQPDSEPKQTKPEIGFKLYLNKRYGALVIAVHFQVNTFEVSFGSRVLILDFSLYSANITGFPYAVRAEAEKFDFAIQQIAEYFHQLCDEVRRTPKEWTLNMENSWLGKKVTTWSATPWVDGVPNRQQHKLVWQLLEAIE
jgi:hypothetical protein